MFMNADSENPNQWEKEVTNSGIMRVKEKGKQKKAVT